MVPLLASLLSLEKETEAQSPSTAGQLGASLLHLPALRRQDGSHANRLGHVLAA